jgi:hypothetical protein
MHIIEMLENNYANEIEGLNLNEQTKKEEERRLKLKEGVTSESHSRMCNPINTHYSTH